MSIQTYKDGYIKSDVVLSIGMLVSNHIQYIEKCMEGLKPLLEAVPSELIILDTVGPEKTDGSIDVCRKYTDKIYRFEWCDDFSAARNELLKHSTGEWFMYQDDDEWFENVTEFIEFFNGEDRHKYNSGFYFTKDYLKNGESAKAIAGRMIRRRPDTCFVGRVHENFNEVHTPGKQFQSYTNHMGYLYLDPEDKKKKSIRNLTLLDREIEEKGINPGRCAQKIQELMNIDDRVDEGYSLNIQYVDELVKMGFLSHNCTQWLICAQARYFLIKEDGEGLVKRISEIKDKYGLTRYAMLVLDEVEADGVTHYADTRKYIKLIADDVEQYLQIEDYFINHPDQKLIETQLDFPRFDTEERIDAMRIAGAQALNYLCEFDKAYEYWKDVNWSELDKPWRYKDALRFTLQRMTDPGPLETYYRHFMNEELFEPQFRKYLPEDYRRLIGGLEKKQEEVPEMVITNTGTK